MASPTVYCLVSGSKLSLATTASGILFVLQTWQMFERQLPGGERDEPSCTRLDPKSHKSEWPLQRNWKGKKDAKKCASLTHYFSKCNDPANSSFVIPRRSLLWLLARAQWGRLRAFPSQGSSAASGLTWYGRVCCGRHSLLMLPIPPPHRCQGAHPQT